jgi:predicted ATP-dependent protease
MNFEQLMSQVSGTSTEKTASDTNAQQNTKTATEAAQEALVASLKQVVSQEKTASANNSDPVEALIKEAQRLAEDEKTGEVMHMRQMGAAFADAAAETWARQTSKIASARPVENMQEKTAAEEQALLQQAAEKGYNDTMTKVAMEAGYMQAMEKVAAEQYQAGQNAALEDVREKAAQEFYKGAQEVDVLLSQLKR